MRSRARLPFFALGISLAFAPPAGADPVNGDFGAAGAWLSVFSGPLVPPGGDVPVIVGGDARIGNDPGTPIDGFVRSGIRQSFNCVDNMPPPQPHCVVHFDSIQVFGPMGAGAGEQAAVTLENAGGPITFDIPAAGGRKEIFIPQCLDPTVVTFWLEDAGPAGYQSHILIDDVTCGCEIGPPNSGGGITTLVPRGMPDDPFAPPNASAPLPFESGEPPDVPALMPAAAALLVGVLSMVGFVLTRRGARR